MSHLPSNRRRGWDEGKPRYPSLTLPAQKTAKRSFGRRLFLSRLSRPVATRLIRRRRVAIELVGPTFGDHVIRTAPRSTPYQLVLLRQELKDRASLVRSDRRSLAQRSIRDAPCRA